MATRKRAPLETGSIEPHMRSVDLRLQVLSKAPFFAGLSADSLSGVNRLFRERGCPAGGTIYYAGDRAAHLYVAADGKVKLGRHTLSGQGVLLDILVRGDFFGSLPTLGDEQRLAAHRAESAHRRVHAAGEESLGFSEKLGRALAVKHRFPHKNHRANFCFPEDGADTVNRDQPYKNLRAASSWRGWCWIYRLGGPPRDEGGGSRHITRLAIWQVRWLATR